MPPPSAVDEFENTRLLATLAALTEKIAAPPPFDDAVFVPNVLSNALSVFATDTSRPPPFLPPLPVNVLSWNTTAAVDSGEPVTNDPPPSLVDVFDVNVD